MHSDRFGNVQELRFETAKSSDMGCATLLEGRFDDAAESSFQCFKFRICAAKGQLATSQKSRFQAAKCSNKSSAILQKVRFADVQESRFHAAKRSNMSNAVLLGCRLPTSLESRFHAAKPSNMSSSILKESRLADAQESRFQAFKRSNMGSAVQQ